jgi:putative ABC transport system permease protein
MSGIFSSADAASPIGVIRIRVGHLRGTVRQQLNQVAQVAYEIRRATGLTVDVTAGSSPTTVNVALPAGKFGRPALLLRENWVRKGVALVILSAVDRESVALFGLVLLITAFSSETGSRLRSGPATARSGCSGRLAGLGELSFA